MKKLIPFILIWMQAIFPLASQNLTPRALTPLGTIDALAHKGDTLYAVGFFREVGYRTGAAAFLNSELQPNLNFPITDGKVFAIAGDGQGGWFLGGEFTEVDTFSRTNLVHVLPSGKVDPAFNIPVDDEILALEVNNQTLYLGGRFRMVDGQTRNYIAAVDLSSNTLSAWNPDANAQINTIEAWNDTMMVGGWFSQIGGVYQPAFAALDPVTAQTLQTKTPGNGQVNAIVSDGDQLYLGGSFQGSSGYFTQYAAGFNPKHTSFDKPDFNFPRINGTIFAIADDGQGGWYIGGAFLGINGKNFRRLAHILPDMSIDTSFHPLTSGTVYALARKGDTLFVGGTYSTIMGQTQKNLAALDLSSNSLINWQPEPDNRVKSLHLSGNRLLVGGIFNSVFGELHPRLAVLDLDAGNALNTPSPVSGEILSMVETQTGGGHLFVGGSFNGDVGYAAQRGAFFEGLNEISPATFPFFNNAVRVFVPDGSGGYYVAGQFTQANGANQQRLAHILPDQSIDPNFSFTINNAIYSMFLSGNTLYFGGAFTTVDGTGRNRAAAIDLTTQSLTAWNPDVNNIVNVMIPDGGTVLLGGRFTSVGGQTRNRLAAVDASTGAATSWNPDVNNEVHDLFVQGTDVYIAGAFTQIGGTARNRLARVNKTSGTLDAWDPNINSQVRTMAWDGGSTLYIGGQFTQTNGNTAARNRLAAIDMNTGNALAFDPNINNVVWDIVMWNDTMMVAGQFTQASGVDRSRLAAISVPGGNLLPWQADPNNTVYTLLHSGNDLLIGGTFTATQAESRNRLMDLNPANYSIQSFAPNVNQNVNALEVYQNELLVGGNFTSFDGQARTRLARYNFISNALDPWNPGADAAVNDILHWNDTMMVAGDFTQLNGTSREGLGGFNLSNGGLLNWNPKANRDALVLGWNDTMMVAGGEFTHFDYEVRNRMMALDMASDEITGWAPDLSGLFGGPVINALTISGNSVWVGGSFGSISGVNRSNLAQTDKLTGQILAPDIQVNGDIYAMDKFNDTMMVVMGNFTEVDGLQRRYGAAVDLTNASLHSFAPEMEIYGRAVAFNDTMMVLGGDFDNVYSTYRNGGYAIDTKTGELLEWHPEVGQNSFITSIIVDSVNNHIYLGGSFTSIQGESHQRLVRVDPITGVPDNSWNASANQLVHKLEWDPNRNELYVTGNFNQLNGQNRNTVGRIDASGNLSSWDPAPDNQVHQVRVLDSTVIIVGEFSNIGGATRNRIAALDMNGQATAWAPDIKTSFGSAGRVFTVEVSSDRIYIGGWFEKVDSMDRVRLAAFDFSGNLLPWAPPVDRGFSTSLRNISSIKAINNHLFLNGQFSDVAGISVNNFAWLDAPSGLVRGLRIIPNSFINAIEVLDSLVYIGGRFSQINRENHFGVASFEFPKGFFGSGFSDVYPNKGGNTGDLTMNIYGAGFDENVQVILRKNFADDVIGFDSLTSVLSGLQIKTTFNLRGAVPGLRDVLIVSGGDTTVLPDAFEITENGKAEPWADVLSPAAIRFLNFQNGGEHKIYISYGNTGDVDAEGVPIWFAADTSLEILDFDFNWIPLPDTAIDPNDSVYYAVKVDTIAGIHFPANVYCIIIPRVPAGFQGQLGVTIKPTQVKDVWIDAWATEPLYGSPLKYFMPACMDALLGRLIGFVPGGDCVYNAMDALLSPMFDAAYDTENFASAQWASNYVFTLGKALVSCGILVTGGGLVLDMLNDLLGIKGFIDDVGAALECLKMAPKPTPDRLPVLNSTDPNQKGGPGGVGEDNWINFHEPMPYLIEFENVDTATAPALQVTILDTLDVGVYNINTLRLNHFTIADSLYPIPFGRKFWTVFADMRPRINTLVRMDATLEGSVLKWEFVSLDPVTLEPQFGVNDGFLPPNVNNPEGKGSVSFTIERWENLPTNSQVSNRAAIVFDSNDALITNTWINTIDNDLPTSKMDALPDTIAPGDINLSWTSSDVGSGIRHVDIYMSINGDPYGRIGYGLDMEDTVTITPEPGNTYHFYSVAVDSVWNEEVAPFTPDASIHILVGTDDLIDPFSSVVYPNPNAGTFVLDLEAPGASDLSIDVMDLLGNTLQQRQEQLMGGSNRVNLTIDQPSGIYMLRLRTKWGAKTHLVQVRK